MPAVTRVQVSTGVDGSGNLTFAAPLTPGNRVIALSQNVGGFVSSGWTLEFQFVGQSNSVFYGDVRTSDVIASSGITALPFATSMAGSAIACGVEVSGTATTGSVVDAWVGGTPLNTPTYPNQNPSTGYAYDGSGADGSNHPHDLSDCIPYVLGELYFSVMWCGPIRSSSQFPFAPAPFTGLVGASDAPITEVFNDMFQYGIFGTGSCMTVGIANAATIDTATSYKATAYTAWDDNSTYHGFTLAGNGVGFFVRPAVPPLAPTPPPFFGGGSPGYPGRGILIIYDNDGNIAQLPQDMMVGSEFNDVVNGGSADATIMLPRRFIEANQWITYDNRVQFFLSDSVYPWYDGRIVEFDPEQQDGNELITIYAEGWSTALDYAIVTESINPGVQPNGVDNGTIYAGTYLTHVLNTYVNFEMFGMSYMSDIPIDLNAMQWDGAGLSTVINDVVTNVQNEAGFLYEWWVRGVAIGLPAIVIQPQQIPDPTTNVVTGRIAPSAGQIIHGYIYEFLDSTIYNYKIQYNSRNLVNLIALYGGRDPVTQQQVYGPFKDSTSISLYGLREAKVTNSALLTSLSLTNYATVYLLLNGYPQPQGSYKKFLPTDACRSGVFAQIFLPGSFGNEVEYEELAVEQQIQQVRIVKVTLSIPDTERMVQEVYTTAPRPYIDQAYYGAVKSSLAAQQTGNKASSTTALTNYYMQTPMEWVGVS